MLTLTNETRTARKPRQCLDCFRTIERGETYRYVFGGYPGDMQSWSSCSQCDVLLADLYRRNPGIEAFEVCDIGRDLVEDAKSLPLARVFAWWHRKWARADGTLLPSAEVKALLDPVAV